MRNCFRQSFISVALRKCKKDSKILRLFLVQRLCHIKAEFVDFLSDFVIKHLYVLSSSACTKARNILTL